MFKPKRGKSTISYIEERPLIFMGALHWEKYFQHICEKYNSIYKVQMSSITPHVCRHTFCSNMAKSGMNPKILQYIMGHSDIGVTLNTWVMNDETALALRKLKDADSNYIWNHNTDSGAKQGETKQ